MLTFSESTRLPAFRQPWRGLIAVGRARDLTRADLRKHLAWLQREIGYRACRFHAIFHDDMRVLTRNREGELQYNWREIDEILDALLSLGLKPFIELNSMPACIASGDQTIFHYQMNVTPPRVWDEWHQLVLSFGSHLLERYGAEEIRTWRFEVWNEPNLPGFWSGTKEDYFRLYREAAVALKAVDSHLQVGGPATSKAAWIQDFIAACHTNNWPVDFVSTHLYPQDEQVEYPDRVASPHAIGAFFADTVRYAQRTIAASPRPDLPIHWTEWNTQSASDAKSVNWLQNVHVDDAFAATFIASNCVALDDACESLGYWVASDVFEENGLATAPLSCTYGLVTLHGFPKASANAFRLLRRLTGDRLALNFFAPHDGCGAAATRTGDTIRMLLWHHAHLELPSPAAWQDSIQLNWPSSTARIMTARVGPRWGSVRDAWRELGEPATLSVSHSAFLSQRSEPWWQTTESHANNGTLTLDFRLAATELLYFEIAAPTGRFAAEYPDAESAEWERKMSDLSL